MNKQFLRAHVQRNENGQSNAGDPIRFTASTEGIKRDGIDLRAEDWWLVNFEKNPVFLWAHDYFGRTLPIGRVKAFVEGNALISDVVFDQADDFAKQVERKYRDGYLHTVSVGWDFVEIDGKRRMDLLDVSGVPVPGDPDAMIQRTFDALKEVVEPEGEPPAEEDEWSAISAAMVGVFDPSSEETDAERQRIYKSLLPKYRRLDKIPPEFRTLSELASLEEEDLAALFLENEYVSSRAGAVLSSKNRGDLEKAIGLLQGILDGATSESDERNIPPAAPEGDEGGEDGKENLARWAQEVDLILKTRSL